MALWYLLTLRLTENYLDFYYDVLNTEDGYYQFVFVGAICAVLSCIFALNSRKRGYRNGVSMFGLSMSIASFAMAGLASFFIFSMIV